MFSSWFLWLHVDPSETLFIIWLKLNGSTQCHRHGLPPIPGCVLCSLPVRSCFDVTSCLTTSFPPAGDQYILICPASRTASLSLWFALCFHVMWCKYVNVSLPLCAHVLPLSLALMIDNVLPFPTPTLPLPLLPFLPLLTLLSAACHRDFLTSSVAGLYLDGQSSPSHVPYALSGILYLAGE